MCIQNVPVYASTMRTCVETCARGVGTDGDVLNVHTEAFLKPHTGGEQGVIVSSAYQNLPKYSYHVLQRFTKETFGSFLFFKFENRLRTTCYRFLQSFAFPDKAVQFQLSRGKQAARLFDSFSPLFPTSVCPSQSGFTIFQVLTLFVLLKPLSRSRKNTCTCTY